MARQLNKIETETAIQLKAKIWYFIAKLVEQEAEELGISTTPKFVSYLVELSYNQLLSVGEDLENFSRHGGRKTIEPRDFYLILRKNKELMELLRNVE